MLAWKRMPMMSTDWRVMVQTDASIPFTIHIASKGYIHSGLAFFVFIDGEYQCNRNRIALKTPGRGVSPTYYEVEFRLRQKEEKTAENRFVAREWTFEKLDRGEPKTALCSPAF